MMLFVTNDYYHHQSGYVLTSVRSFVCFFVHWHDYVNSFACKASNIYSGLTDQVHSATLTNLLPLDYMCRTVLHYALLLLRIYEHVATCCNYA